MRDVPNELREIVADHLIDASPLGSALLAIADGLEQQAAGTTAALNAVTEQFEGLEERVLDELGIERAAG